MWLDNFVNVDHHLRAEAPSSLTYLMLTVHTVAHSEMDGWLS